MTGPATPLAADQGTREPIAELRVPARIDHLKLIRAGVEVAARMCGFDWLETQDVVLAVDEACQNIIVHGYRRDESGEIVINLYRCDDGLRTELRDTAPRVDPDLVRPRALGDVRPGKLGSHFMRTIMDEVEFRAAPGGGNILEMHKRRSDIP